VHAVRGGIANSAVEGAGDERRGGDVGRP
jgi:hypothetical protein